MSKTHGSLASKTIANLRRIWGRKSRRPGFETTRRPRFEFLEGRAMMHAGHDHDEPEAEPTYNPNSNFHIHYQLDIVVNGDQLVIPKGIGNNLGANSGKIHTHDFSGLIHVHPGPRSTFVKLGEVFDVWRNDTVLGNANAVFSSTNIFGNVANGTHTVRMYVNGELNTQFENYEFNDGDKIVISYEPIDGSNKPTFEPIANQTLPAGAPLWIPLDGLDANGGPLTYSVSVSNPNLVQASIPTTNRSLKMVVNDYGTMTFQLFDHLVPEVTNRMAQLINAGFYNQTATNQIKFHRVVPNFVIQAGDPTATGSGGSNLGDFDDKFHADLQHTSAGFLSMAKSGDDTNDSQFFVTDGPTRHLDFNHSIWGRLTDGEEVRDAINSVPVTNSVPNTAVVINSMSLVTDTENGVLMLKAAQGASGTSDVTVTVTDAQGNSFARTFTVTVAADATNGIPNNSAPFLENVPASVTGAAGQAIALQLQAFDVENDPKFFDASGPGVASNYTRNLNSTTGIITYTPVAAFTSSPFSQMTVNSNTGAISITPKAGFAGSFDLTVGVRGVTETTTQDQFDIQTVTVQVPAGAPTVDLVAAFDSGNNSDNVTNAAGTNAPTGAVQFTVSNVTSGALVKLMKGNTVLAQGTASGTSITLTTTSLGAQGDGVHGITATQTVGGAESPPSAALEVTLDTTPPGGFSTTAPTEAQVGVVYTYDANNSGNTTGVQYQLVTPPSGMTINASGVVTWTPTTSHVGARTFGISAVDAAGNAVTQTVNVNVSQPVPSKVEFSITLTRPDGTPLTNLGTNQDFVVHVFAKDLRSPARGVFAAYMDVLWDSTKATVTGPIQYTSTYGGQQTGDTAVGGIVNEVGAFAGTSELGSGAKEVFSIPMRSTGTGNLVFTLDPSDILPSHEVLVYGMPTGVPDTQINFGTASVTINATFNAVPNTFNVNEDSTANVLDPLANDTNVGSANNVLTISAVGPRSNGGTVTISQDGKTLLYTPAANFSGTETFTYTARNQNNETATATITVQVQPQNDAPTAVANSFNVDRNSTNTVLDVLANDLTAPDTGETLRVSAVGTGSQGGTITIVNNGSGIRYTPKANFTGTETFTYTISDRATGGLTSTATVTINVTSATPTAVNDQVTVAEDTTTATEINVLANDLLGDGSALTITAVGTASKGGTVTITQNGTRLSYIPAANAQGVETFTYTVSNGLGTATGTVTVTLTNTNDAPTANNDTVSAFKDVATVLNLLANDSSAPDPTENLVVDTVTQGAHGTVTISADGKTVSYTPTAGYTGADTFTYTIRDPGGLGSNTATVNVNVQNFAPSSLAGFVYFDVDDDGTFDSSELPIGNVTITLTGTDSNNAAVNRTVQTQVDGSYKFANLLPGTYTISESPVALTMDGKDTAGSQGGNTSTNDKIVVTLAQNVNGVNNNFGEKGRQAAATVNGEQVLLVSVQDFFSSNSRDYTIAAFDNSGAALWHTAHGPAWEGYLSNSIALQNNKTQLKLEVTNPQSQPLTTTLPVTDSRIDLIANLGTNALYRLNGAPSALSFQTIVVNQPPVAAQNQYTVAEDADLSVPVTSGVLVNDTDPENTTLTAVVVTQPTHGTLALAANGSFTYTPAANYNGPDSFTYRASDGTNFSQPATVNLTVTAVNDAPSAQTNSYSTNEDTTLTVNAATGVLANDTDDGTSLTASVVATTTHGALTLNADGSFTYVPTGNYSGPDSFTYKVSDGTLESAVTTVNLTVTAVNDTPVAGNDSFSATVDTDLTIGAPGVLSNDTDVEGTALIPTVVTQPEHGEVTVNANGSFTYTPDDGYEGPDSFTYTVSDGTLTSAPATVTLTVEAGGGEGEANDAALLALTDDEDSSTDDSLAADEDWAAALDEAFADLA